MDQWGWFEESFSTTEPFRDGDKDYPYWEPLEKYWNHPDFDKIYGGKWNFGTLTPVEKVEKTD